MALDLGAQKNNWTPKQIAGFAWSWKRDCTEHRAKPPATLPAHAPPCATNPRRQLPVIRCKPRAFWGLGIPY
jgi:hypothetical protein